MRRHPTGMPIPGTEGKITAEQQEAVLRPAKPQGELEPADLPLTPAQHQNPDAPSPPGWERTVVRNPDPAAMGARPTDYGNQYPIGSMPEGIPVPLTGMRPELELRKHVPVAEGEDAEPGTTRPITAADAAELRASFAKIARQSEAQAAQAKASGEAVKESRAAEAVAETNRIAAGLEARGVKL